MWGVQQKRDANKLCHPRTENQSRVLHIEHGQRESFNLKTPGPIVMKLRYGTLVIYYRCDVFSKTLIYTFKTHLHSNTRYISFCPYRNIYTQTHTYNSLTYLLIQVRRYILTTTTTTTRRFFFQLRNNKHSIYLAQKKKKKKNYHYYFFQIE